MLPEQKKKKTCNRVQTDIDKISLTKAYHQKVIEEKPVAT